MKAAPRTTAVAQRLRAFRETRGLSQAALARAAGMSQALVLNYETGKREVKLGTAMSLAAALDVTLWQVTGLETDPWGGKMSRGPLVLVMEAPQDGSALHSAKSRPPLR